MPDSLRERKKVRTRAALEDAALRLFTERGVEHTTVADIAAAAEVAPRTFFAYFEAKEDAALGDVVRQQQVLAEVLAARPEGWTTLQVLRAYGTRRVDLARDPTTAVRRRLEASSPALRERSAQVREAGERTILEPEFARDLGLAATHPKVQILVAAYLGISVALDDLLERARTRRAAERVVDDCGAALEAALAALSGPRAGGAALGPGGS